MGYTGDRLVERPEGEGDRVRGITEGRKKGNFGSLPLVVPETFIRDICLISRNVSYEIAGFLIGEVLGECVEVLDYVIGENTLKSNTRFELEPRAILEAHKYAELLGAEVVALFHTHFCEPVPSEFDLEGMRLWPVTWVIIDVRDCRVAAWRDRVPVDMLLR